MCRLGPLNNTLVYTTDTLNIYYVPDLKPPYDYSHILFVLFVQTTVISVISQMLFCIDKFES